MRKKFKILASFIALIIFLTFLAACVPNYEPSPPDEVVIIFLGAENGVFDTEWTGLEQEVQAIAVTQANIETRIVFEHEGSDEWVTEQPTTVGNHQVKAYIDEEDMLGEIITDFIIRKNTSAIISADNAFRTTANIHEFDPVEQRYLNTDAILERDGLTIDIEFYRDGMVYAFNQLAPGQFYMNFSVSSYTHIAQTSSMLTIVPDAANANFDSEFGGWFSGLGTFVYNSQARAVSVFIPKTPYFSGNYVVRYSGMLTAPINVGVYDIEVEIEVIGAANLVIDAGQIVINRRDVRIISAFDRVFDYDEVVQFSYDISNYLSFGQETIVPDFNQIDIRFERYFPNEGIWAYINGFPSMPGAYRAWFSILPSASNFAINNQRVYANYIIGVRPMAQDIVFYNLENQVFGNLVPIDFSINDARHVLESVRFFGQSNDGTTWDSAFMPVLAGEYAITVAVRTSGVIQYITKPFNIYRAHLRWTANDDSFFIDNMPSQLHNVYCYHTDQPIPHSDFIASLNFGGTGFVDEITTSGVFSANFNLSDALAVNFYLMGSVTAEYTVFDRPVPTLETNSVIFNGNTQFPPFSIDDNLARVTSFSPLNIDGTPIVGIMRYARGYIIRVVVEFIDGISKTFDLEYTIEQRQAALSISELEFEEGEPIDFGISFYNNIAANHALALRVSDVVIQNRQFGTNTAFNAGAPSEPGAFEVQFSINNANFEPINLIKTAIIFAYGSIRIAWDAPTIQTYSLTSPLSMIEREDGPSFVSISFYGTANDGTVVTRENSFNNVNDGATTPVRAGNYLIELTLDTDGEVSTTQFPFVVARRNIELVAQDMHFAIGDSINHQLSADGFDKLPDIDIAFSQNILEYRDYAPVSDTISTHENGVFIAHFNIRDSHNFWQIGDTVARYVVVDYVPSIDDIRLLNSYTTFVNIAPLDSNAPIGKAQPVTVLGANEFHQILAIYYTRTHRWLGAQHGDGTAAFVSGGAAAVATNEQASQNAPSDAGIYSVAVHIYNAITGDVSIHQFEYTIYRQEVIVSSTLPASLTASSNPIRLTANSATGANALTEVTLFYQINEPWLNHAEGYSSSRRRAAISMVTIECVHQSINPIITRSSRPITSNIIQGAAHNLYAVTHALAQLPPNARAGLYRITYTIDQPNFFANSAVYITITPREGDLSQPLGWINTMQGIDNPLPVLPTPRAWQSHNSAIYFEGINGTSFDRSTTMPAIIGTFRVSSIGISDGVEFEWVTTLTIVPQIIRLSPQDRIVPFHMLGGNVMSIELTHLGVEERFLDQVQLSDFDIFFYRYVDGTPSPTSTTIAPSLPGRYRVTFQINSYRNPNFSSEIFEARYEIMARTGQIGMPPGRIAISPADALNFNFPVSFSDFHLDRTITFEGIGATVLAPTTIMPTALGLYRVTVTAYADTIRETLFGELHIRLQINTGLNPTLQFAQNGNRLPNFPANIDGLDAANYIEYTFINRVAQSEIVVRLDGSPLPSNLPFRPGPYQFSVRTGGGIEAMIPSGTVTVIHAGGAQGIQDAIFYAAYYFENIATDFISNQHGWSLAAAPLGVQVHTIVHTTRIRSSHPNSNIQSYFRTTAAGNNTFGEVRLSFESIVPNLDIDRVYFRERRGGAATPSDNTRNRVHHTNWGNDAYRANTRHYFTNQAVIAGNNNQRWGYGVWVHGFSGYNLAPGNINTNFSRNITNPVNFGNFGSGIGRNPDGTYWVRFGINDPGQAIRNQVRAFSNGQSWSGGADNYHAFYMRLDRYGRVMWIRTFDSYGAGPAQARLDAQEWFVWGDIGEDGTMNGRFHGIDTYLTFVNTANQRNVHLTGYLMQHNFSGNGTANISYRGGGNIDAAAIREAPFNLSNSQAR